MFDQPVEKMNHHINLDLLYADITNAFANILIIYRKWLRDNIYVSNYTISFLFLEYLFLYVFRNDSLKFENSIAPVASSEGEDKNVITRNDAHLCGVFATPQSSFLPYERRKYYNKIFNLRAILMPPLCSNRQDIVGSSYKHIQLCFLTGDPFSQTPNSSLFFLLKMITRGLKYVFALIVYAITLVEYTAEVYSAIL